MAKTKRPSRRETPWPRLGKPIAFGFEDLNKKEQYQRMLELKKHFNISGEGVRAWYQLALAIAAKFDEGLTIEAYKEPPKRSWRGVDGKVMLTEVEALKETTDMRTDRECLNYMKANQKNYSGMSVAEMAARLSEARKHHLPAKKLRTWDGRIITKR